MKKIYVPFIIIIVILLIIAAVILIAESLSFGGCTPQDFFLPLSNATITGTFEIQNSGFVPANVSLGDTTVALTAGCYRIEFDVTGDQAFSISHGISNAMSVRPLTHDVLRDVIEGFNISILSVRIERFGDDIYYARMFMQQGGMILDMDVRPSDAIALSLRTKNVLYVNETMMKEKGTYIC
jgi:hypothetical protein